jgi:hypothetical protein
MPPTAAIKTRNGFHIYWVLDQPISWFDYTYPASLVQYTLKSDPRSLLPAQCLNLRNDNREKPGYMVDVMEFPAISTSWQVFPHVTPLYSMDTISDALSPHRSNPALKRLKIQQARSQAEHGRGTGTEEEWKERQNEKTISILEHHDVLDLLRSAGVKAHSNGSKITLCCPYHDDRHPSAFLDLNPANKFFGTMFCVSSSCGKHVSLSRLLRDLGYDI